MKVTYYPGCSLESTAKEYDDSIKETFRLLGVELVELEDWNCCGATSGHCLSETLAVGLPARNLALASQTTDHLLVPCAACYNRQKRAEVAIADDPQLKAEIEETLDRRFERVVTVQNLPEFLCEQIDLIKEKVTNPLADLKVVCYYGCLLTRPPKVLGSDNCEDPKEMDKIAEALGATSIPWSFKTECCGGALAITKTEIVVKLVSKILQMAKEAGADAVITACPLCATNLDTRQGEAESLTGETYNLPILFISELVAVALGSESVKKLWRKHFISPAGIL